MLWRANGFAKTTVADICRAAGVSKALFYFYFPRKEDVLFEFVVQSEQSAYEVTGPMLDKPYELADVITAALASLEADMSRNTPELVIQTIVEGYRRIVGDGTPGATRPAWTKELFAELFARAQSDGKLPAHVDVPHLATVAQSLVSEGARRWAAGAFGERSFADVVARDIVALVTGYCVLQPFAPPRSEPGSKIRK
jgi:AcrR family transcriptional regulator